MVSETCMNLFILCQKRDLISYHVKQQIFIITERVNLTLRIAFRIYPFKCFVNNEGNLSNNPC